MEILGIDYGQAKIGLAVGDTETGLVEPLAVLQKSNIKNQISKIIEEAEVGKIVIGMPGGRMDEEIRKFGVEIGKLTGKGVEFFDETLTTQEAQKVLIAGGGKKKARREKEDAMAAAIMLEYFMKGGQENV